MCVILVFSLEFSIGRCSSALSSTKSVILWDYGTNSPDLMVYNRSDLSTIDPHCTPGECCVEFELENIIDDYKSDFLQRSWQELTTLDVPYDLGSVMHYGPTAFTNDGSKKTVLTVDRRFQRTIGQREQLSFLDIQIVNRAYCTDRCPINLPCFNGGYTNPNNCEMCICPDGTGGLLCDKHQISINAQCGGMILAGKNWSEIHSPGYPKLGYDIEQKCSWIIRAPESKRVQFKFVDQFQFFCSTTCLDFVEIKASNDFTTTGFRFCCSDRPDEVITSKTDQMIVIFRSIISKDIGFKAQFRYVGTSTSSTSESDQESTPTSRNFTWTTWGGWSICSRTCGGCGIRSRIRRCLSSSDCRDEAKQHESCNEQICPAKNTCRRIPIQSCNFSIDNACSRTSEVAFSCNLPSCCPSYRPIGSLCVSDDKKRV